MDIEVQKNLESQSPERGTSGSITSAYGDSQEWQ